MSQPPTWAFLHQKSCILWADWEELTLIRADVVHSYSSVLRGNYEDMFDSWLQAKNVLWHNILRHSIGNETSFIGGLIYNDCHHPVDTPSIKAHTAGVAYIICGAAPCSRMQLRSPYMKLATIPFFSSWTFQSFNIHQKRPHKATYMRAMKSWSKIAKLNFLVICSKRSEASHPINMGNIWSER